MGLLSNLLGRRNNSTQNQQSNDSYNTIIKKCLVEYKLRDDEYDLFSLLYYQGHTSYRDFFKFVFNNNISKMKKIVDLALKKADQGCNIDFTFVRFYKDNRNYIDIPFDVFTDKRNMRMTKRNTKIWNKENIKRLLLNNPNLRNFDDSLLEEAIEEFKLHNF